MRSAEEIRKGYTSSEKEKKFQRMMEHQEKVIDEAVMKYPNDRSRLFIFSDKEYFHGMEKEWFTEFYDRAKRELESAGYRISGICVCWE